MDDAERQRAMDFILRQQAQFAAGTQRLEEQRARSSEHQLRADDRTDHLRGVLLMTARQFRRERRDLRERMAALVDAQVRTEEAVRSLTATTGRNSKDIATSSGKAEDVGDGGDSPS